MKTKKLLLFLAIVFSSNILNSQNISLSFNGTTSKVALPAFNLNSNAITFEAWIKPNGVQKSWSGIIISGNTTRTQTNRSGLMFRNNNELGYMWEDSHGDRYGWSSGLIVPPDMWSYIALVITPTNVTVYLNKQKATHNISNDAKPFNGTTWLGTDRGVSGRSFKGLMDEIRIWNLSRTESEITENQSKSLSGRELGLKGYYKMDDKGSKVKDYTTNNLSGTRTSCSYVTNSGINANFIIIKSLIESGTSLQIKDVSFGMSAPTSWKWTISGPSNFENTVQNPYFTFNKEGSYNIKLLISDGLNKDSLAKTSAVIVASADRLDSLYFVQKKDLLTATWTSPFNYQSIKTNYAPVGPFMGNGDVGVVCHTAYNSLAMHVSKVNFVTDGWNDWAGNGPAAIPAGFIQVDVNSGISTGFRFEMDEIGNELRMNTATTIPVAMRSWMGTNNNYIITELSTNSNTPVNITVKTIADSANVNYKTTSSKTNLIGQVTRQTITSSGVRWISQVGISTKILGAETSVTVPSNSLVKSEFTLTKNSPVYVISYISGGGKGNNPELTTAYSKLSTFNLDSLTQLKITKNNWWKDMWTRSYVETNDDLLNRHYLSSIYVLASGYNRHSSVCGGMYGVWNMSDSMMYHGDIHLNYNSQAGFYSVYSANRPEIAMPFYQFLETMIPEGKFRAKNDLASVNSSLTGKSCRGILFPVSALGIGNFYGPYWSQTMDAPFNVSLFSWYYEYTGDINFLRNRAYPFILEVGNFYEDYLVKETVGSSYRYNITTGAHENSWDLNPPSDLGLVEQTFKLLLRYSQLLDIDSNRRILWQDILTHLPAYKVIQPTQIPNQAKPVFAKNETGWDYPNHVIQLQSVYPCEVLTLHSDPHTIEIAKNTLQYYEIDQNGFTGGMNQLGLSAFIMGARLGFNPDILITKMKALISNAKANFLIVDGHHLAEKTTPIEVINSMMIQSIDSILYLFPNWVKTPASFTRIRTKGAFLVSADYDGNKVATLKIYSDKGNICKVQNPWDNVNFTIHENNNGVVSNIQPRLDNNIFIFKTKVGATYTFDLMPTFFDFAIKNTDFNLYPNPAETKTTIEFEPTDKKNPLSVSLASTEVPCLGNNQSKDKTE